MSNRNSLNFNRLTVNQYPFMILLTPFDKQRVQIYFRLNLKSLSPWPSRIRSLKMTSKKTSSISWTSSPQLMASRWTQALLPFKVLFYWWIPVLNFIETTPACLTDCLGCRGVLPCSANPPPIPYDACCGGCPAGKLQETKLVEHIWQPSLFITRILYNTVMIMK